MNRGIARRTVFERAVDVDYFLERLALEVRKGEIEVHAYSFLTTHFHLLLRSPRGHLSAVQQRVGDAFVRSFNRGRRRDGSLFRGRFVNRLVESEAYWLSVLRYIDRNPVGAGLVVRPVDWPHGSACWYARSEGPPWLTRNIVEAYAAWNPGKGFARGDYERFSDPDLPEAMRWLVERRLERPAVEEPDPLGEVLGAAPGRVREWMERKARLADGTSPGWTVVSPGVLEEVLREHRSEDPGRTLRCPGGPEVNFWEAVAIWTLRQYAGLRLEELGRRMTLSGPTIHRRVRAASRAMEEESAFRRAASSILAEAVQREFGGLPRGRVGLFCPPDSPREPAHGRPVAGAR